MYGIISSLYYLLLHPLRNHPGPPLLAINGFLIQRMLLRGTLARDLLKLHEKYGPVVRIGPNKVSYAASQAYKDIYMRHGSKPDFEKDLRGVPPYPNGVSSMQRSNQVDHARMRKLFSHAFSEKGLREQEPLVRGHVDDFITALREEAVKGPLNMVSWFSYITFDIVSDLGFAEPFGCVERRKPHPWMVDIPNVLTCQNAIEAYKKMGLGWVWPLLVAKPLQQSIQNCMDYTRKQLDKRISHGKERGDFWDKVIDSSGQLHGLSRKEWESNAHLFILAGSETTATLLSGLFFLLPRHADRVAKLTAELDGHFESEEQITLLSVHKLTYMLAVIDEALRLYPPTPLNFDRRAPKEGAIVCDRFIPGDVSLSRLSIHNDTDHGVQTSVMVPQYPMHRMPENFHDPHAFHPERFLPPDHPDYDSRFAGDNRSALVPFAVGPSDCLGRNLAYAEMRLIVAKLLWNFEVEHTVEVRDDWMDSQLNGKVWFKPPLWVNLRPRKVMKEKA